MGQAGPGTITVEYVYLINMFPACLYSRPALAVPPGLPTQMAVALGEALNLQGLKRKPPKPNGDGGSGWSGRTGSNRRRSAWEADILPLNYARLGWLHPTGRRLGMPDRVSRPAPRGAGRDHDFWE